MEPVHFEGAVRNLGGSSCARGGGIYSPRALEGFGGRREESREVLAREGGKETEERSVGLSQRFLCFPFSSVPFRSVYPLHPEIVPRTLCVLVLVLMVR